MNVVDKFERFLTTPDSAAMRGKEMFEILRLARLGLWAEQKAIGHLISGPSYNWCAVCDDWAKNCPALAALPKESA